MAWELRGWRLYYYQKKRSGRSVFSKYVGHGPSAYNIYIKDLEDRKRRKDERDALKREHKNMEDLFIGANKLNKVAKYLMAIRMTGLGFKQHKGEWRRKNAR